MQKIVPHLWYDREAKEAALFYTGVFDNSRILDTAVIEGTPSGDAEMVSFQLEGQQFAAISAGPFFKFNPSISFMVACGTPEEVEAKYAVLSEGGFELMPLGEYPFSKRYAWIQDRYGVSWQIVPEFMDEVMYHGSKDEKERVTEAFLKMKKFDIEALEQARTGGK